mmetsp:Transcript_76970/g.140868  ORF Transcript_76970/g.140868 Transcript_76970/m.140868 type:complete len:199 (+) Transcript_76970:149-745(+)
MEVSMRASRHQRWQFLRYFSLLCQLACAADASGAGIAAVGGSETALRPSMSTCGLRTGTSSTSGSWTPQVDEAAVTAMASNAEKVASSSMGVAAAAEGHSSSRQAPGGGADAGADRRDDDEALAAELRAVYLEAALREKLEAGKKRRADAGGAKRLRPVSFKLRESHGGRAVLPPPPLASLPSLRSPLSFLRSSLRAL